jgi:hypothetical protein
VAHSANFKKLSLPDLFRQSMSLPTKVREAAPRPVGLRWRDKPGGDNEGMTGAPRPDQSR